MVDEQQHKDGQVVIIGAGPAGLTAALELTKHSLRPIVLEKSDKVGGISRTEDYKGYLFDMGGHRFFTKSKAVQTIWKEILGDDFLRRPRLSRIYYRDKFFNYPIKPLNALRGLGLFESALIGLSYLRWQVFPYREEETFEQWVTNRFGKRLFQTFFETYTEKVWGIPCSELRAEWAAQRIKNLSLKSAILSVLIKPKNTIKTLIEEFDYPRYGPGMLWNAVRERVQEKGGSVRLESEVVKIHRTGNRIDRVVFSNNGHIEVAEGTKFISSMPVTELVERLDPPAPREVLQGAGELRYRDFLTVCLVVDKASLFPDNWIYIHDPAVKVGRIQNFKNWSPDMVPDPAKTSLGLEYFCNEGDELWCTSDEQLVELGKKEVERLGLADYADIEDGCVFRVPRSYPVYDSEYRDSLAAVREFVDGLENLQTIGRNGLHRYNNQDHAMLTGMLAVRNLVVGEQNDLWSVNAEQEYHEETRAEDTLAPEVSDAVLETLGEVFARLDAFAFSVSTGIAAGLVLFLATALLVLRGGNVVGPNLQLLSQYFPGYSVTAMGSLLGLLYGFVVGFIGGLTFAYLRNTAAFLYLVAIKRRAELHQLRKFLDYI